MSKIKLPPGVAARAGSLEHYIADFLWYTQYEISKMFLEHHQVMRMERNESERYSRQKE
jgi:hypothetical protein